MKTFTLSAIAVLFTLNVLAQVPQISKDVLRNQEPKTAPLVGEKPNYELRPVMENQSQHNTARTTSEAQIGITTYDLMTNGSMLEHIVRHENGTMSTAWTFSTVNNWSTRGTGYNFFNGTTWGTAPTAQLESVRTGWPTIGATAGGKEIVIAHDNTSIETRMTSRSSVGSGSWTQAGQGSTLASDWWHKFVVGGPEGNTIHLIGITQIDAFSGTPYNGLDGALLYARSTDQGASWDITDLQLPGIDSTTNIGFSPDTYTIDAEGDVVAIVVCGLGTGVRLM
ncbi:MAG: hypothetical protein HN542_04500 [Flavobacteriales bacterium]|jgi:hypothetical protein|nr:hypothetical protein [Flavobacteriales bacterium]NCG30853.1 hypothetical protein [Bacteroidota bacterium]MBT4705952.1 hypothetical protein [Flavobacteriales bacterium]MBT4931526.1 hypothetical protein [Flavobacteriales bacterium]MBT5131638.1 hypothetical protein [Flavobacteriales bacterium]